jgi:hypothetical protein
MLASIVEASKLSEQWLRPHATELLLTFKMTPCVSDKAIDETNLRVEFLSRKQMLSSSNLPGVQTQHVRKSKWLILLLKESGDGT